MLNVLRERGIRCERDAEDAGGAELLGLVLDPRSLMWRPNGRKFWRICRALRWLLDDHRPVTGREVEKLLGHLMWVMMLRRDSLCLMGALYELQPLWASGQRELTWIRALLPLLASSMKKDGSPTVTAYDAS